ncbi:gamma-aminobutyrate permease [Exiguobacterium sp. BMC-KP]|uniref:amino acid permease n=1 Tax=Exiguobacterium sp. BMC-KP TaxID=1684312 RepID=UPI0006AA0F79|nr:amino acid permease [Exiguobacterium sp. BMC-KP]KOP28924.1 gamma-aminobutyrate permease [Exiguobacterium sp. BMC-KP]
MMSSNLKRDLTARQVQMIALGGTIGVGLFLGASSTIAWTGPSVLLAYMLAGVFIFFIMRALGEMVYTHPHSGSYAKFANDYIHPAAGFLTASSNIFNWVVVGMSEVIAVGTYLRFWWPELPTWIPGVVVIILLTLANLASVKMFGELEFWFASIKVITILLMIVAGFGIIFFGLGNDGNPVGFSNLWENGGFFTNGFTGFFFALSIVFASYIGVELIGVTAGETKDPEKNITKAINGVVWRILIFYVGSIFIIVTVYPWNELSDLGSPFVATFAKVGVTIAAGIINFVVITAALSGCNSGIFSASRMIYTLAEKGQVPSFFLKVNKRGIPFYTVLAISVGIFFGVILDIVLPLVLGKDTNIFVYVYSASVLPGMVPWFAILISHIRYRKLESERTPSHPFKMPGAPVTNYLSIVALLTVLVGMLFNDETRVSILIGIAFLILSTIYYIVKVPKIEK